MIWRLLPHVSACIASDLVILLDTRRDRYFALPVAMAPPVLAWLSGEDRQPPFALEALLLESGIQRPGDPPLARHASQYVAPRPSMTAMPGAAPAHPSTIFAVTMAIIRAWRTVGRDGLGAALTRLPDKGGDPCDDSGQLPARAACFVRARRWCPIRPNCLRDSLALHAWLGPGAGAKLVIGVIGEPFEAHCWVQAGDRVINDHYDRVSRFTPILTA